MPWVFLVFPFIDSSIAAMITYMLLNYRYTEMRSTVIGIIIFLLTTTIAATPILQSVDAYKSRYPDAPIAISGESVYVTWPSNKTGNQEIMFRASNDNGQTFSDKINLSNSSNGLSHDEEISASGNNVYVVWRDNKTGSDEVFVRISTDSGQTFDEAIMLNSTGVSPLKEEVRIMSPFEPYEIGTVGASSGDNTYVSWWDNKTGNWEVLLARSTDNGETFEDTVNLSNSNETTSDRSIIAAEGENIHVTWWETAKNGTTAPVISTSSDNGATFGSILRLAANGTLGETQEE